MASNLIPEVTDATFQVEVLDSKVPVLVDFTAPWCGPCKTIVPALESLVTSHAGKLKVTQLNVDESQEIAQRYRVMSMPTIIVFRGGQVAGQVVGAHKDKILALAQEVAG
jgi:thioredoxin 1